MYDDILLPTDGSDGAETAFDHAVAIADRFDATVHVLYVADTTRDSVTVVSGQAVDALEREGETVVERVVEGADTRGVSFVDEVVQGAPAPTIAEYADEREVDLVVMPTRGRSGLRGQLLGSVTEKVVRLASVPVLTLRVGEVRTTFPYEDLLVATDGSPAARAASDHTVDLAAALDATLHVVAVTDPGSLGSDVRSVISEAEYRGIAEKAARTVAKAAREAGVDCETNVVSGRPHEVVRDTIDDTGADMVALGATGRDPLNRLLLGSVTDRTIRSSPVPVLTVRKPESEDGD